MLGTRSSRPADARLPDERRVRRWPGFTLLELVAALGLSGLVAAGVWRLVSQLADGEERVRRERSAFTAAVNGERLLRSIIARAESGPSTDAQFIGDATAASFRSWWLTPGGWLERCRATLAVTRTQDGSAILLRAGADDVVVVRRRGAATLLYYDSEHPAEPWSTTWTSDVALPGAIGVAFGEPGSDTLVLPTGAR